MKRYIAILGLLLYAVVFSSAQTPLRLSKMSRIKEVLSSLNRHIDSAVLKTLSAQPHKLPIDIHAMPSANLAQKAAKELLQNAAMDKPLIQTPSIEPLEQNIHRFVFTISPKHEPGKIAGTGFVFVPDIPAQEPVLWGATTTDVARKTGKDVIITFHTKYPQDFSFPAQIVEQGHPDGVNAALIRLPEQSAIVALPIELSPDPFPFGDQPLMAYGFNTNGSFYKKGLSLGFAGTDRLVAQSPRPVSAENGNGGLVVNAHGQALGIYNATFQPGRLGTVFPLSTSRATQTASYLSEVTPITHLTHLLKEYRVPHSAARALLFDGMQIGKVEIDEAVRRMKVVYKNQESLLFPLNPFWTLSTLHEFIPDLKKASYVEIYVSGGKQAPHLYKVDLEKRFAKKIFQPTLHPAD